MRKSLFSLIMCLMTVLSASAAITEQGGWYEAAYVKWSAVAGATDYYVYVKKAGGSYTKLDKELVRKYPSYFRADAVGLAAGSYQMKVVPVIGGTENASEAMESSAMTVVASDRNGFAHVGQSAGVGAYKNDGTLKDNARVLYVTANDAKTVSLDMQVDNKGKMETRTGLQDIIQAYEKAQETRPLAVRIIGTIKAADMDYFASAAEGLQVKSNGSKYIANLTIEGIGNDAAIHGFGILCRGISNVEFRNFAIMVCMDDCLSLDTDNKNVWIHNMDFFYGGTGGDADQAKGDGTVDIKGKSSHVTVSYNHFYDSGKCSLGGMKSETTDCWMTYHHNWFDHSDSRHPRIRTAFYHVYNNYFDGNAKYGVGVTMGGSAFVENNFFRNCKYPMLISKQGTDAQGDGTFSGEAGGVIKAYNNYVANAKQVLYYDGKQTDGAWDAVKASSRDENVTATAYTGGTPYNNAATTAAIAAVPASAIDAPEAVQAKVRDAVLGAGRMNGGDFVWKFNNAIEDPNYGVITELKSALVSYKSTLVGFANGTSISNGGATAEVLGGNGVGISQEQNDKVVPEWGASGDGPEEEDFEEDPYIASADDDMFWFGENAAQTTTYQSEGVITFTNGNGGGTSKFEKDFYTTTTSKGVTYTSDHVGAFNLAKSTAAGTADGGELIFYCPNGATTFKFNYLRSGDVYYTVSKSLDGKNYTTVNTTTKAKAGVATKDISSAVRDLESTSPVWIKITNASTGNLYIFGVQINQLGGSSATLTPSDLAVAKSEEALNIGDKAKVSYTTSSTSAVNFSSNAPTVATVDAEGNITAVGEGKATITVSQAKDATYKAGSATITVTVTDPRAKSTFALTSDATVNIKETETSQITTTGAAGNVTYSSSNTKIATVDEAGKITAVGAGSATITVTDPGNSTTKGGSASVTVTVTKDMAGKTFVKFPYDGKALTCTDPTLVTLASANGKNGLSVSYNGETITSGAKMESATVINITPTANAKVTLVFDLASKKLKIDDETYTTDANGLYTFTATGGTTYVLKKGDSMNLVGMLFDFGGSSSGGGDNPGGDTPGGDTPGGSTATAINFPTSTDGITAKGTTVMTATAISIKNSYSSKDSDGNPVYGNGVLLAVKGGFKKGDVVTFAGTIAVATDDASYATKVTTTAKLVTVDPTDESKITEVFKFGALTNTKESSATPADQTYTLDEDFSELWLVRDGSTTVNITKLVVSGTKDDPTPGPGPDPKPESADLINYQHEAAATAGITLSGTTAMSTAKITTNSVTANGIKLANGYTTDNVLNDNYIKLAVDGGFKKGDVVTIAGFFNNSDDTKMSAATLFVKDDSEAGYSVLFNTDKFINGRLVNDNPVEQTYTLEADADELYIGRNGNTATLIYTLKVTRPAATGGSGDVNGDGAVTMADANAVVNFVVTGKASANFDEKAADVNGDGKINKADADAIVNKYLLKEEPTDTMDGGSYEITLASKKY
ncbi:MAG: Ig-like domain-containing protein [Prevotella sp.]|nr:Ig-like domain-containing protein [Candidatus Prevotella equi]